MDLFNKFAVTVSLFSVVTVGINAETQKNRYAPNQQIARGESRGGESRGGESRGGSEEHRSNYDEHRSPAGSEQRGRDQYHPQQESSHPAARGSAYEKGVQNSAAQQGSGSVYISPEEAYNPYAPSSGGNQSSGDGWSQ